MVGALDVVAFHAAVAEGDVPVGAAVQHGRWRAVLGSPQHDGVPVERALERLGAAAELVALGQHVPGLEHAGDGGEQAFGGRHPSL